jgi:ribosome biogenesis GTPase / thiamine phosphate phosphatase
MKKINNHELDSLEYLGWDTSFSNQFQLIKVTGSIPARVTSESRGSFQVMCAYGELDAVITGKMRLHGVRPVVGDWVVVIPLEKENKGIIHAVLSRKSKFSRKVAGECTEEQVISANIDTVFIVNGLDGGRNLNLRRIERYLTLAWNSGAVPVIILNKADLCADVDVRLRDVEEIAPGAPVFAVSAREQTGLDQMKQYLKFGETAAFLGSSGVGKSALINALLGEEKQQTGEVRQDDLAGRHTTTSRQLICLPDGGLVIDTPGMRELQMWGGEENLQGTFSDIKELALKCRFNDCTHTEEPGCAVQAAVENGDVSNERLESYRKLQLELNYSAAREENRTRQYEKMRWKKVAKLVKEIKKRPDKK